MKKCERCGDYYFEALFSGTHSCRKFTVWEPAEGDTYEKWGCDAEDIAGKIAEQRNCDEPIFDENIFEIPIRITDDDGVEKWFNTTAEPDIHYSTSEVEAPENADQL